MSLPRRLYPPRLSTTRRRSGLRSRVVSLAQRNAQHLDTSDRLPSRTVAPVGVRNRRAAQALAGSGRRGIGDHRSTVHADHRLWSIGGSCSHYKLTGSHVSHTWPTQPPRLLHV